MAKSSISKRKKVGNISSDSKQSSKQRKNVGEKRSSEKFSDDSDSESDVKVPMRTSFVVVMLATFFAVCNSFHQSSMFENDRHFSHLSTLEREMTFRTEMGLYYSYFKTLIEAPSLWNGIHQIMNDNRTEYPNTINTLERFNLYPEVILAAGYRSYQKMADFLSIPTKECWKVMRGGGLPDIVSCEGLGDPAYFYTTSVFLLNSLVGTVLFIYGRVISNSVLGGVISAACFFFNHGECTRVQWTPPLRESFGYPIFILQMLIVTIILLNSQPKFLQSAILSVVTALFLLFWQFAQFALFTQVVAIFIVYVFRFTSAAILRCILLGHVLGLSSAAISLFGNKMLLMSLYSASLIAAYMVSLYDDLFRRNNRTLLRWASQITLFILGSFVLKYFYSFAFKTTDDAHIWSILKSKFSSYKDFHTMLYTCAIEFDFLEKETYLQLTRTFLLPLGLLVVIVVSFKLTKISLKEKYEVLLYEHSCIVYNFLQLAAFFVMAVLIMRLKLLFTPHLCIITSLFLCPKFFSFMNKFEYRSSIAVLLLALMAFQGVKNIQHQRSIVGEFSNPELEDLILWINSTTSKDAVFAGPMPTMANLLLSTRRPIVNHPHYENAELRERTHQVYKIFSRKSTEEVYDTLLNMYVDYAVVEQRWCHGKSREGCAMVDLWDNEDLENSDKRPFCQRSPKDLEPFKIVFQNSLYTVLAL